MGGFRLQCLCKEKTIVNSNFGRKITDIYGGKERDIWELPLSFETMKALVNGKAIDIPSIPLDEIQDKCGRDALSKAIAMLQLTWFILQIIARVRQNLAVTALELTTAALASLNIAMYISWWSKPTDIVYPTTLRTKKLEDEIRSWKRPLEDTVRIWKRRSAAFRSSSDGVIIRDKERVNLATHYWTEFVDALSRLAKACSPTTIFSVLSRTISAFGSRVRSIWSEKSQLNQHSKHHTRITPSLLREKIRKTFSLLWQAVTHIFLALIYYPILAILQSGKHLKSSSIDVPESKGEPGSQNEAATDASGHKVDLDLDPNPNPNPNPKNGLEPTPEEVENMRTFELMINSLALRFVMDMVFFCEDVASAPFLCLSAFSGAIFGMIHCLAWNFAFPSHVEQILWRTSASAIAGLCIFVTTVALVHIINQARQRKDAKLSKPTCQTSTSKTSDPDIAHEPTKRKDTIGDKSPTKEYDPTKEDSAKKEKENIDITEVACSVFAICFVLSRLSLLTLSVLGLRDLPDSAFDTVQWAGFIPHI